MLLEKVFLFLSSHKYRHPLYRWNSCQLRVISVFRIHHFFLKVDFSAFITVQVTANLSHFESKTKCVGKILERCKKRLQGEWMIYSSRNIIFMAEMLYFYDCVVIFFRFISAKWNSMYVKVHAMITRI